MVEMSLSSWAFPVVLVSKDESYRLCIDCRKLNTVTVPDFHLLPRVDDIIDNFEQAWYLIKLDLLQRC